MMNLREKSFAVLLMVLMVSGSATHAEIIARDSFVIDADPDVGYTVGPLDPLGGTDDGQGPNVTGMTNANWVAYDNGTGLWSADATGLDNDVVSSSTGGSARWTAGDYDRYVSRALDNPIDSPGGNIYWISALVELDGTLGDYVGGAYGGYTKRITPWHMGGSSSYDDQQGFSVGVKGDGSELDLVLVHRTGSETASTDVLLDGLSLGTTYQVVIKAWEGGGEYGDIDGVWVDPPSLIGEAALGSKIPVTTSMALFNGSTGIGLLGFYGYFLEQTEVRFDEMALTTTLEELAPRADVLTFTASEDICLDKGSNNQNSRDHLLVGCNAAIGPYSALVAFDFSGVDLGSATVVESVIVEFYHDDSSANGGTDALTMRVNQYDYDFDPAAADYEDPVLGEDAVDGGTLGAAFGSVSIGVPDGTGGDGTLLATLPTSAALVRAVQSAMSSQSEFRLILTDSDPNTTNVRFVRIGRASDSDDNPIKLWVTTRPAQGTMVLVR